MVLSMRIHSNIVKKRDFRKLHLASECRHKEKPIYSWELTSAIRRHDSPRFRKLLTRITGELGEGYMGIKHTLQGIMPNLQWREREAADLF